MRITLEMTEGRGPHAYEEPSVIGLPPTMFVRYRMAGRELSMYLVDRPVRLALACLVSDVDDCTSKTQ